MEIEVKEEKEEISLDYDIVKEEYTVQEKDPILTHAKNEESLDAEPTKQSLQMLQIVKIMKRGKNGSFRKKAFYTTSLLAHDLVDQTSYVCPLCSRPFKKPEYLRAHIRRHNDQECVCPECGKRFSRRENTTTHIANVHLGKNRSLKASTPLCKQEESVPLPDEHLVE